MTSSKLHAFCSSRGFRCFDDPTKERGSRPRNAINTQHVHRGARLLGKPCVIVSPGGIPSVNLFELVKAGNSCSIRTSMPGE